MKVILIKSVLILISFHAFAQSSTQKIDSLIGTYTELNRFNGNILVSRSSKTILQKSYGYKDIENNIKCSPSDIFQLASLTKSFTAVLIMSLVEKKKLSLNTLASDFFPELHPEKKITIAHLLNHTSGLRETLRDRELRNRASAGMKITHQELLSYFCNHPLDFEPGTNFSYSNSGYDVLGMIIEEVTGKSYAQAVKETIFGPLRMTNSGYDFAKLNSRRKTKTYEYISSSRFIPAKVWDASWGFSSGGLYSNIEDLNKWNKALKQNKIISSEALEQCYTAFKGDYGYGWFVDTLYGKRIAYHAGNLEGATSYFARIPEDDICIIMLNNETSTVTESIADKIVAILYDKPYTIPKRKQSIQLTTNQLKIYVGDYNISDSYNTSVQLQGDQLYLYINNEPAIKIHPEGNSRFFINDSNMSLIFKTDESGKQSLVIRDGLSTKVGEKRLF